MARRGVTLSPRRWWWIAAVGCGVAALVAPPTATAEWLRGGTAPGAVVSGVWFAKLFLALHAVAAVGLARSHPDPEGRGLLPDRVPSAPPDRGAVVVLAGIVILGFALRMIDLGNGLWYDEIQTLVEYVRLPLPQIISTFDSQNQHLLYSVSAHLSVRVFGESAWALRLPAALFGVASLAACFWFGKLITRRGEALLATAFLALSYHHVWFSQNARGYTGVLLWTLLSSGLFLRLLRGDSDGGWRLVVMYAMVTALAVYTHVTAAVVGVAHALVWMVLAWRNRATVTGWARWRPAMGIVLSATVSLQLYALVLPQFFGTLLAPTMPGTETEWKNPLWLVTETVRGLAQGVPGGLIGVVAGLGIVGAGAVSYGRRTPAVTAMMVVPGMLIATAIVALHHNLWPRFFFFTAGFAALLVFRGIAVVASVAGDRAVRTATVAGIALILASGWTVRHAWNPKQDFGGARVQVERLRGATDAVVTVDLTNYPYRQFMQMNWDSVATVSELLEIERSHSKTWILYTFPTRLAAVHQDIWDHLERSYTPVAQFGGTVGGGAVIIKVRG